jgi:hypothetical protein
LCDAAADLEKARFRQSIIDQSAKWDPFISQPIVGSFLNINACLGCFTYSGTGKPRGRLMDERQIARTVTDAEVTCEFDGVRHRLSLFNLSARGCMMDAPAGLLVEGRRLKIEFPHSSDAIAARVIWQTGHYMGVRFVGELSEQEVESLAFRNEPIEADLSLSTSALRKASEAASPARRRCAGR